MKQRVATLLAPFALFEWGAILTYFYFSHRLAGFLHPSFRPPVLVTGFLLMGAAVCVLFSKEEPEAQSCDCENCDHSHAKLTLGGLMGFLVLLLPVLLAAKLSPDSYGEVLVQNRGAAESLESVPGALARAQRAWPRSSPVYAGDDLPTQSGAPDDKGLTVDIPKGWGPPNAPEFSTSKNVPDEEYPSNEKLASLLRGDELIFPADPKEPPRRIVHKNAPLKALNEQSKPDSPFGSIDDVLKMADSPLHEGGAENLKTAEDQRCLAIEVVDLLVAAQNPALMKELNGKRVELTGQVLGTEAGNFRLLRLLILCCAADAQPLAVRIETHENTKPVQMTWVKVVGKASFAKNGKGSIPVVSAEKITVIPQPDEPYLY